MSEKKCPQCGSLYELDSYHVITRDRDSIECDICGATIKEWSGSESTWLN
jgi:ribosomal protein S27E